METTANAPALSAYVITWAEFFPVSGIVTKHDRKQFGDLSPICKASRTFRKPFGSKRAAVEFLQNFNKPLNKAYTVRLFSDKQLSRAKAADGYRIPYTRKQWAEVYTIGK